ncbi:MAG: glycosyltransferase family 4 protein [Chthonomonadaceae bacterium]|nr:glycosyltransferase family 4 protein [Chthonomonadaceae bacterium]
MSRLTICLDARLLTRQSTGDTSYWKGLVDALLNQATEHRIVLCSNAPRPKMIPSGAEWRLIHGSDRWWSLVSFPLFARKYGFDLAHTQYNLSPLLGRRGVTTIHDVSFLINPGWYRAKDRYLLTSQIPKSISRAAGVITVSETSRQEIERFVPNAKGKVFVTYNALGDNIRPLPQADVETLLKELGVPRPYLLTVGTRWPRKNTSLAVLAASLAGKNLVVTGRSIGGADPVGPHYTGYVSDSQLTALYQGASLYLAPSLHEGFGIPLLEAFACKCPVLVSQGGALPEIAGGAAEVADSFEPALWAETINHLCDDESKLERYRRAGLRRLQDFSWQDTAKKTLCAYEESHARSNQKS